ncbi:MarC family protein [Litoribacillus peritrichatus]|uniref:UPF0056 membrane protein n=1 Tax=Litoribacillus peritrichatus TaxID=718191 RepID=A0ABP7N9W3_9GAMM
MTNNLVADFIFFFAVIDPIGTIPVFIAVTRHYQEAVKVKIALKATLIAALILLFFVVAGELILNAIEIPLAAFQIAGGIVLFLFALSMIFGESKPDEEVKLVNSDETAVFPLAIPSLASPGAMLAAVLLTKNGDYTLTEQAMTTSMMLLVLLIAMIFMLLASKLYRLIGFSGASIISRVMGLILTSVAVASILEGIKVYFKL